jgi:prefoldin alpha subunit
MPLHCYPHFHGAGQPVLLPLTESLYVSGALESVESVLLEVGTGYYVEVRV